MTLVLNVLIFGIFVYGLLSLGRLAYVKSVPLRHKAVNHGAERKAITLEEIDRFIRDQEHQLYPDKKLNHVNCSICGPGPLKQGVVPSKYPHPFFVKTTENRSDGYGTWRVEVLNAAAPEYAEIVSSKVIRDGEYTGEHTLMIDLDLPCTLIESSTAGHYHLYIDHPMTWHRYLKVVEAMADAGLVEQAYYRAAKRQRATMLRPPWVKKPEGPSASAVIARDTGRWRRLRKGEQV